MEIKNSRLHTRNPIQQRIGIGHFSPAREIEAYPELELGEPGLSPGWLQQGLEAVEGGVPPGAWDFSG